MTVKNRLLLRTHFDYFIPAFGENKLATSIDKRGIHYKDFLPIDVAGILSPNSKK